MPVSLPKKNTPIIYSPGGGGGGGVGDLFHILKHQFHLKRVFVQNSNNCLETFKGQPLNYHVFESILIN